jgi:hypothetical protein
MFFANPGMKCKKREFAFSLLWLSLFLLLSQESGASTIYCLNCHTICSRIVSFLKYVYFFIDAGVFSTYVFKYFRVLILITGRYIIQVSPKKKDQSVAVYFKTECMATAPKLMQIGANSM